MVNHLSGDFTTSLYFLYIFIFKFLYIPIISFTYAYQISSKAIAEHYGRDIFVSATQMFYKYHCYGIDYFIRSFADKNGLPADVSDIVKLGM